MQEILVETGANQSDKMLEMKKAPKEELRIAQRAQVVVLAKKQGPLDTIS